MLAKVPKCGRNALRYKVESRAFRLSERNYGGAEVREGGRVSNHMLTVVEVPTRFAHTENLGKRCWSRDLRPRKEHLFNV
jgi:hypothetical protein